MNVQFGDNKVSFKILFLHIMQNKLSGNAGQARIILFNKIVCLMWLEGQLSLVSLQIRPTEATLFIKMD